MKTSSSKTAMILPLWDQQDLPLILLILQKSQPKCFSNTTAYAHIHTQCTGTVRLTQTKLSTPSNFTLQFSRGLHIGVFSFLQRELGPDASLKFAVLLSSCANQQEWETAAQEAARATSAPQSIRKGLNSDHFSMSYCFHCCSPCNP